MAMAPILAILSSAIVAIYVMLHTAREVRLSYVHEAMCKCLVRTLGLVRVQLDLLGDISSKVVYKNFDNTSINETAYDRYWKKIGTMAKEYSELIPEQRLFLHEDVYESLTGLVDSLNKANNLAKNCKPSNENIYPDVSELENVVAEAVVAYLTFVNKAREFVGADELTRIAPSELKSGEESV